MASNPARRSSGSDLLLDLQALNQSLSQPPTSRRRNGSLTLQGSNPSLDHPRRLSLSQWQKRGIKDWKPIRMLTRIGMRRISSLFLVEVIAVSNLPESMNGLRLSFGIRKRESRDAAAVRSIPSRVLHGCAQFEETHFIRCNVHCSGGAASGKPVKLEPRPFQISVVAVDEAEIELGRTVVDLSQLIEESIEENLEGARIWKWEAVLELEGMAEGGQLSFRVGFQIIDDGGVGIYNRAVDTGRLKSKGSLSFSSARGRENSMNSFSTSTLDSMELDSIANEVKDLESMMNKSLIITKNRTEKDEKELDGSEETVKAGMLVEKDENQDKNILLPDLGNGLGPVIQTRDGGFMASVHQFNDQITRKETPKLALQISKPFVLRDPRLSSGLEVFRRLAAVGLEELCSKLTLMAAMDELLGKTAGQIAFEGIASAIRSGRNKDGASSFATKSIGAFKRMTSAMSQDMKRRSLNENWSIREDSISLEEIMALSIQRIEGMALEALKIQADMAEEAAFEVSPLTGTDNPRQILDSAISIVEDERTLEESKRLTLLVIIQMRDQVRQYVAVGAPVIALIQAIRANDDGEDDDETRYKVISIHVGGLKVRSGEKKNGWEGEKSKLTATQWLVENGMGKLGKKSRPLKSKFQQDLLWSLTSRIMENMWLTPVRNPDVRISKR